MNIYCENCGQHLRIFRKAIPKLGTVIDLVEYHKCPDPLPEKFELIEDLLPKTSGHDNFAQSLEKVDLTRPQPQPKVEGKRPFGGVGTDDLRDRRFDAEQPKSTAPGSVMEQIKAMTNSIPSHDLKGIEEGTDSEMGG